MLKQTTEGIKNKAMEFDNAFEKLNVEELIPFFSDDCEISLLNVILKGKEGAKKFLNWMIGHIVKIKFEPVTIMVDGDTFFEEFIVKAKLQDGTSLVSKQAEVLVYENYKIKSLRLYFDRLDFVNAVVGDFISKKIIQRVIKKS
ncbi:MAG: nuclear transport factor 2 family protein, partial [Candidatus Heimdallarchaeota archaeon]